MSCHDDSTVYGANTCRQTLCNCDKILVEKLLDYKDIYNTNMHHGSFNKEKECVSQCQIDPDTGKCVKYDACCNDASGKRKPFFSKGGRMKCCVNRVYDSTTLRCCGDRVSDVC